MSAITAFVTLALGLQAFLGLPVDAPSVDPPATCTPYHSADAEAADANVFVDCDATEGDADVYGGVNKAHVAIGTDGSATLGELAWKNFHEVVFPSLP